MTSTTESPQVHDVDDAALLGSLRWYRRVVLGKVAGLTRAQATSIVLPSGVTLLGIVQHLAIVEREWFGHCFRGETLEVWEDDATFHVDPSLSLEDVVEDYRASCRRSEEAVAGASFDEHTREPHWFFGTTTLRFVVQHMVKETARHAGHMDILRELTDGVTGDDQVPDDV